MKLAHVVVTIFCVRTRDMFRHVHGPVWSERDPLRRRYVNYRLKLLETICLPSILAQSCRDFTWVILVDGDLDTVSRERLERVVRPGRADARIRLREYRPGDGRGMEKLGWLKPYLAERPDYVVTTACDSDEALPRRFVETVRTHVDGLAARGALPLVQIMGMKKASIWDMLFTREAPFGWVRDDHRLPHVGSSGFALLSRYSCDVSVMGMRHTRAEAYFGNGPGNRHLDFYRRRFRETLGPAVPTPDEGFFDVSSAGGTLVTNHGANVELSQWRPAVNSRLANGVVWEMFKGAPPGRRKVTEAETFQDFAIDWNKLRLHARDFNRWRVALRTIERKFHPSNSS